eukprot:CAMPEP_0204316326 /NCGR_PEP_ID=MMETSP0469-20131031/5329_1 /ASSEMBLY_ACC=CAM_ASM_000384 /TAXON_ID=2969 /ORGANISM="Oxyrrhis marina" /LENGTH=471 /DNA_ID=CAMNT_0051297085 /DNA_START=29 /DNA_END=1444 /DNA_ORIENTATION=+
MAAYVRLPEEPSGSGWEHVSQDEPMDPAEPEWMPMSVGEAVGVGPSKVQLDFLMDANRPGLPGVITVVAPEAQTSRCPIDLTAVIDRSGSMQGSKIELVKKTMKFLLSQLRADDRFGLVTFDHGVREDFPLTFATEDAKTELVAKIAQIQAGTTTNLSGGLLRGLDQQCRAHRSPVPDRNRVLRSLFLFTDGQPTVGVRGSDKLLNMLRGARAECPTTVVHCFGFGDDHDEHLLTSLAGAAGGEYLFVEDEDKIGTSFGEALGGLLSVVAQSTSLTITEVAGFPGSLAFPATKGPDSTTWTIDLGDLFAEERRDIPVRLLPAAAAPMVSLRYFNIEGCRFEDTSIRCRPRQLTEEELRVVARATTRVDAVAAMREAAKAAAAGSEAGARGALQQAARVLAAHTNDDSEVERLRVDLGECMLDVGAPNSRAKVCKKLAWLSSSHGKQRSVGNKAYTTPSQHRMADMCVQFVQ